MSERNSSTASRRPGRSRRWRVLIAVVAVLATGALAVLGPRGGALVARQMAWRRMIACEFGPAQRCLSWSAWLDPGDYDTDLLAAACQRQRHQRARWIRTLREAEDKGAPDERVALELKLSRFRSGGLYEGAENEIDRLAAAGASFPDIAAAFLHGYLAQERADRAKAFLESLPGFWPDRAHGEYLWGVYWRRQDNLAEAETRLKAALDAQPGHELARLELAEIFEERDHLDQALGQYVELQLRAGEHETAAAGLARVLRKLARLDEARTVLAPLVAQPESGPAIIAETAQVDLQAGNYEAAEQGFRQVRPEESSDPAILFPAAITFALRGKMVDAERLFGRAAGLRNRTGWISGLRVRLANNPDDRAAAEELEQWARRGSPTWLPRDAGEAETAMSAADLFALHCGACHGAQGDGRGPATRHLFPRPRNLRTGRFQLVSTLNGVATLGDLEKILARGMPGTSMAPFDTLSQTSRQRLAQEVLRLRREGVREQVVTAFRREGEEIDEADLRQAVERSTIPGEAVRLPPHWPILGQAAAKGKASFAAIGCNKCHGDEGTGDPNQSWFDDQGEATRPRDLVHEPFKGGHDPESIYLRIAAGMPGTLHPAAWNLPEEQLVEVVDYVRWLAREPQSALTNHQRRVQAASRDYFARLRESARP